MFYFLIIAVGLTSIGFSTKLAIGQYTTSNCKSSAGELGEILLGSFEEQDHKIITLHQNLTSTLANLGITVSRNFERGQQEHDQNMKLAIQNFTSRFEAVEEKRSAADQKLMKQVEEYVQNQILVYQNASCRCHRKEEEQGQNNSYSLKKLVERFDVNEQKIEALFQNVSSRLDDKRENVLSVLEERLHAMYQDLATKLHLINDSLEIAFANNLQMTQEKLNAVLDRLNESLEYAKFRDHCLDKPGICDCSTIRANGYITSGVYRIYVDYQQNRYYTKAFCDMRSATDSWTVFQRRKDGSEDFYRDWRDYENGFGDPNGEFWLGNIFLHFLTLRQRYRLRIELGDFEGQTRYAQYSAFNISSSSDKYRLSIGNYNGDAGDSLSYHNGRQFSTKDQDNDVYKKNCSITCHGAWWYGYCDHSNLNGNYYRSGSHSSSSSNADIIDWQHWRGSYSLKTTEMKISPY